MRDHDHSHLREGERCEECDAREFPGEITFKAVYKNLPYVLDVIRNIFSENGLMPQIETKLSRTSKYISFTFSARFESEAQLNKVCSAISRVEGFTTMF
ncbi:MAG: DUF493 family protein [Spirochaetes bacterium]|nr:MAG: DUF493 family protein [Spirochaetota bacterium]